MARPFHCSFPNILLISQEHQILKVGLTGGIGSGKTTVAKIFETLGIPVYYADDAAKGIMNENFDIRKQVIEHFGEDTYSGGVLNRGILSSRVFSQPHSLDLLNSIVHPATIRDAGEWMLRQTSPYVIKEAALIFEADSYKDLDYVIGVSAPATLRRSRTVQRDLSSPQAVQTRMDRQMDEDEKMKKCDFIILNDESKLVVPQVIELHKKLLNLAENKNAGKRNPTF